MPKMVEGMPQGVRRRGSKYQWDVSHKGTRRTGTTVSLASAVQARAVALQELLSGVGSTPSKGGLWTLQRAYEGALATKWDGSASIETSEKNIRYALEYFGPDCDVNNIDEEAIDEYRDHLRGLGNLNATINRKTSALSVVLKYAYSRKGMLRLPAIGRLTESNTHERYISDAEERKMIDTMFQWGKREHAFACIILIDTGMRSGELFSLRKDAIDFTRGKHGVLSVWKQHAKTARSRTLPLTQRAAEALRELYDNAEGDKVLPYDRCWLHHVWDRVKEHVGLGDVKVFTPHLMRHTFCSRLAKAGVPIQKIAYLAGHTNLKTTMRYSHLSPVDCEGILDVLESSRKIPSVDSHAAVV